MSDTALDIRHNSAAQRFETTVDGMLWPTTGCMATR